MRRIFRAFCTPCTAMSLLLFVAACVFWLRSYWLSDQLDWRCDRGWRSIRTAKGHLVVGVLLVDWSGRPADFYELKYQRGVAYPPFNYLADLNTDATDV